MILFIRSFLRRIATDNISFLAGGVAFYSLLSIFPAMAAIVSIFGLCADPQVVRYQLEHTRDLFPAEVFTLIHDQITTLVGQPEATLSITAMASIVLAISAANRGTKAMVAALNTVFRIQESRSWWRRQTLSYAMTIGAMFILILAMFIIVALPLLVGLLSPDIAHQFRHGPLVFIRWLILGGALWSGILLLFVFGPSRSAREQDSSHVLIGATVAAALWLISAFGLSWFVQKIPNFHAAYGSLSAVIVLMLWMVLSSYAILIGAAFTASFDKPKAMIAELRA